MFYREFTFDKNDFRASDGNKVELADNVIWLDDLLILIQIKERNHADAKTDQVIAAVQMYHPYHFEMYRL